MKIKIGQKEIRSIIVNLICMKLFLTFPRNVLKDAGNAAWMISIYILLIELLIFYITDKIYRTNKNVLEIAEEVGGRWLKIIVGIVMFLVIIFNISFTIRVFPESVRMILLHGTPMAVIIGLFCFACIVGTYNGIESLARITSLFLPIIGTILIIFIFLIIPHFQFENIAPLFGYGQKAVFIDGINEVSFFSDIIALNFLLPICHNKKEAFKAGYKAIIISGLSLTALLVCVGFIYPSSISEEFIMPLYQLTRIVKLGDFFSRFEAFFEFIWCIAMLLYTSIYVYILCDIWKSIFNLKYYKPLIMPIVAICIAVAYIPDSIISIMEIYGVIMLAVTIISYAVPILFGVIERIRNHN